MGKKEENLIKTASCFCIVHDPRGGLRTCRDWYTMSLMFRTPWSGRSHSTLDAYCLVYDGDRNGINGVGPSHLGAFRDGVYHLGHVRFQVFTLAHIKYWNTAMCSAAVGCSCGFLLSCLADLFSDESSNRRCIRCLCNCHIQKRNQSSHLDFNICQVSYELLLRSPLRCELCLAL